MKDFEKYSIEDLRKLVADKREELRTVRFGAAGSRSRNTSGAAVIRKEIARALTELRQREIAQMSKKA